jgi:hypothetical protein
MRYHRLSLSRHRVSFTALLVILLSVRPARGQGAPASTMTSPDWSTIEQTLGRKGAPQPGGVIKFGFPRGDMQVTVAGVPIRPALALGSWVAFAGGKGKGSMVMGDLVLAEDEVGPVTRKLQDGGIDVTALHNHLEMESPRVMYMHIGAVGDPQKMAAVIRSVLTLTKTPMGAPAPSGDVMQLALDTALIAKTLGVSGKVNGGVYQVSVPRLERITDKGMELSPAMGVATALNFQPTGGGTAAVTGDFVMTADEVNPVMRALSDHAISITAVHSHMLDESPRLFFVHFWANDTVANLSAGLRAALDRMNVKKLAR